KDSLAASARTHWLNDEEGQGPGNAALPLLPAAAVGGAVAPAGLRAAPGAGPRAGPAQGPTELGELPGEPARAGLVPRLRLPGAAEGGLGSTVLRPRHPHRRPAGRCPAGPGGEAFPPRPGAAGGG